MPHSHTFILILVLTRDNPDQHRNYLTHPPKPELDAASYFCPSSMPAPPLSFNKMSIPSNVLDDIQKWISDQKALGKASSGPVQVPVTIYDAALALHACIAVQPDAPAGDETNWIGLLTREFHLLLK